MNQNFITPTTFMIGATSINLDEIVRYLEYTNQQEFLKDILDAKAEGINDGEILCSFYAKLCYASLTDKKNLNISRTRSIHGNVMATIESLHGSVFEHVFLNFVVTDCSRVFTHELVRHRVGTSFSQTSGRYVRSDVLKLVVDPILTPAYERIESIRKFLEEQYKLLSTELGMDESHISFDVKKKITSAMRRILPNGQSNEIGFGVNLRTLRFLIQQRTSRHAEWEIRLIFNQIADLVKEKYPLMFCDATFELVDGQTEITFKNHKI